MFKKVFTSVIITTATLLSLCAHAQIDISSYELKENQIEILRKFEAKGKYTDEWLHKFAQAMHNQNIRERNQRTAWVPTYTEEELWQTVEWARGGAFAAYAEFAGYKFDGEAYRADCPNVGLFRFGRASGTEFIPVDVAREAFNQSYFLQARLIKDKENFAQIFWEEAQRYGFDKYLKPLNEEP